MNRPRFRVGAIVAHRDVGIPYHVTYVSASSYLLHKTSNKEELELPAHYVDECWEKWSDLPPIPARTRQGRRIL